MEPTYFGLIQSEDRKHFEIVAVTVSKFNGRTCTDTTRTTEPSFETRRKAEVRMNAMNEQLLGCKFNGDGMVIWGA